MMMETREIYWNVGFPGIKVLMIGLGLVPIFYIIHRLRERWQMWRAIGTPEPFPPRSEWPRRAKRVLTHAFAQTRVRKKRYPGIVHMTIFWSFILLFIGTVIVAFQSDVSTPLLGWYFFSGQFYKIYSITLELAGVAGIAACAAALYRRYAIQPSYLGGRIPWATVVWCLLAILISGFVVEAARLSATRDGFEAVIQGQSVFVQTENFEPAWSFVGYGLSQFIPQEAARLVHWLFWWGHLAVSIGFLCVFGERTMGHVFTTCLSIFLARDIPSGATPRPIPDIENAERFGVLALDQFNQLHLRDSDMCVECGRCQDVCPAWATGKPLSPKKIVNAIRDGWEPLAEAKLHGEEPERVPGLIGELITQDEIWACTTCGACEQACPVMIEQVEKIVEMRRGLVLMEASFPQEVQVAFDNMERSGNPWGKPAEERADWAKELDFKIPVWGEDDAQDAEYLFWVGCSGSYDAKSQVISQSLSRLLKKAGVKFAILGTSETCTGDPALRIGNEYLYQTLATQNIETLTEAGVKKIVTACPHCFQTLGKDYPLLGALQARPSRGRVIHHSELLERLLAEGKLDATAANSVQEGGRKAVFHDSCYLARHNNVVEEPRAVAAAALGVPAEDPRRERKNGFCCGAGGGRMWMEENLGHKKVNVERAEELLENGADTIVTSCPFCKTMLSDGAKVVADGQPAAAVMDIAELLDKRLAKATVAQEDQK
jgi:Fe-S oxidoreductase